MACGFALKRPRIAMWRETIVSSYWADIRRPTCFIFTCSFSHSHQEFIRIACFLRPTYRWRQTQDGRHITKGFTTRCLTHWLWHWRNHRWRRPTAMCFPRLPNLDIVYIISSLPRLPHTALIIFGKNNITTSYLKLNIHSINTVSSILVYLTFDDYNMTVMMICLRDDDSPSVSGFALSM